LYIASTDWPENGDPADPDAVGLRLLFDDPEFVDAEPVGVYPRKIFFASQGQPDPPGKDVVLRLEGNRDYRGPMGRMLASGLYNAMMNDLPGQQTDTGEGPVFSPPPAESIRKVKIYASHRDRFDDPANLRVSGNWELLLELPAGDAVNTFLPTDTPTVLAGFGADGKVVQWESSARDSTGTIAKFYAFAGDHYSLTAFGGKHFCVGCHPGHSGLPKSQHKHAEQLGK
jgi:hypothetical protein